MKSDLELLREEIRLLRGEIRILRERVQSFEDRERERDLEDRSALLQIVADRERRHKIGKYSEKDRSPVSYMDSPYK